MSQPKKFADTLWHDFETTFVHITKGRHDLKTFKAYIDERAKIEEQYAKSLESLAKAVDFESTGTISALWDEVRETTKQTAQQHRQVGQVFSQSLSKSLDAKMKDIKKTKNDIQKQWNKINSEKERNTTKHHKAKEKYVECVKQAETAVINHDNGNREGFPPPKQAKLEKLMKSAIKDKEKADKQYSESVTELRKSQETYDSKMIEFLNSFDSVEHDRAEFLKSQLNDYIQNIEMMKGGMDQILLRLQKASQELDTKADIQRFIDLHETKETRAPHVQYEPAVSNILDHAQNGAPSGSSVSIAPPKAAQSAERKAPTKSPAANARSSNAQYAIAHYDFEAQQPEDLPFRAQDRIKVLSTADPNWWTGELNGKTGQFPSNYVVLETTEESPKRMDALCEALYDFESSSADELSFKAGDKLKVTGELNGWYLGKTADEKRVGIFPSNYVKMIT